MDTRTWEPTDTSWVDHVYTSSLEIAEPLLVEVLVLTITEIVGAIQWVILLHLPDYLFHHLIVCRIFWIRLNYQSVVEQSHLLPHTVLTHLISPSSLKDASPSCPEAYPPPSPASLRPQESNSQEEVASSDGTQGSNRDTWSRDSQAKEPEGRRAPTFR